MDMTEADRAKLVAHCALAAQGEPVREALIADMLLRYDGRGHRLCNAVLDAIRMCEPGGSLSAEERLSRVQWTLYRAIRDTAADMAHDLRGDRDPMCAALGIEIDADEGDMQNYDDRGEPVTIGGA